MVYVEKKPREKGKQALGECQAFAGDASPGWHLDRFGGEKELRARERSGIIPRTRKGEFLVLRETQSAIRSTVDAHTRTYITHHDTRR